MFCFVLLGLGQNFPLFRFHCGLSHPNSACSIPKFNGRPSFYIYIYIYTDMYRIKGTIIMIDYFSGIFSLWGSNVIPKADHYNCMRDPYRQTPVLYARKDARWRFKRPARDHHQPRSLGRYVLDLHIPTW